MSAARCPGDSSLFDPICKVPKVTINHNHCQDEQVKKYLAGLEVDLNDPCRMVTGSVAGHLRCWKCPISWDQEELIQEELKIGIHSSISSISRGTIRSESQHQFHWPIRSPIFSESSFPISSISRAKESSSLFQMMADEDGQVSYSRFMDGMNRAKGLAKAAACQISEGLTRIRLLF